MMKLEQLIMLHAKWADKIRYWKAEGVKAIEKCECESNNDTCLSKIWERLRAFYDPVTFEDIYEEEVEKGRVCQHCVRTRFCKRQRMYAIKRLGAIRGAITRIGRAYRYNNVSNKVLNRRF